MSNLTQEALDQAEIQLFNQKEKLIKKRLKALKMLHVLRDIKTRRFKKLMIVVDEVAEHVYIDNGTHDGLRVISFVKPIPKVEGGELDLSLQYF